MSYSKTDSSIAGIDGAGVVDVLRVAAFARLALYLQYRLNLGAAAEQFEQQAFLDARHVDPGALGVDRQRGEEPLWPRQRDERRRRPFGLRLAPSPPGGGRGGASGSVPASASRPAPVSSRGGPASCSGMRARRAHTERPDVGSDPQFPDSPRPACALRAGW